MKNLLIKCFLKFYSLACALTPTDRHAIIFESNLGNNYSGSPKAIYEKMVSLGLDKSFDCYFVLKDPDSVALPGKVTKLKKKSPAYFKAFSKAGIWVADTRMPLYLIKKKDTRYIQTWHGTPLKKLALDMDALSMGGSTDLDAYKKKFVRNSSMWDYLISQNAYSTEIFRRCFAFDGEMLEYGYPRCDVLFEKNNKTDILKLKEELGLPTDKRIILYAPTWRDNQYYSKGKYKYESPLDFAKLKEAFGEDTVFLIKYHYLVADTIDTTGFENFVFNFSQAEDISPLYLVSDAMITDYSSTMFDYAILDRPMYFFCYDLESYRDTLRGFYFDFEQKAPGPIVKTTAELIDAIRIDKDDLFKDHRASFREFFVSLENGQASEKVVRLIQKLANHEE